MSTRKPWLKHYPEEIPPSLDYPDISLCQILREAAERFPEHECVDFMGKTLTYKEVIAQSFQFARALRTLGLKYGDRVAIMLPNCPQFVIAYYGALFAGGVVTPVNPLYTERELTHQLQDSGAMIMLCLDLVAPKVLNVKDQTDLRSLIVTGIHDYLPFPKDRIYALTHRPSVSLSRISCVFFWKSFVLRQSDAACSPSIRPRDDLALLQYTGGTTGEPKGVMLTHANLVANTYQARVWFYRSQPGMERVLTVLPLFHVYAMTTALNLGIWIGASLVLVPKFDVDMMLKAVEKKRPSIFPGAPTVYVALLNHPRLSEHDLTCIKACVSGSAPLPLNVQETFESMTGGRLVEGYGLTESSPVTHANPIWGKRKCGSIGLPWPDTDCKIADLETGEDVTHTGRSGELLIKGPQVMKGYWRREEETNATVKDGWLSTGDIGYMDEDGYFYIVDRKKDMIIAGGLNIYPREVEEVLYEHPAVKEAVVIGVKDGYRGETVKAFVVCKEGCSADEKTLDRHCRRHLAPYKVPRQYEFRERLPKSSVGKILRRMLKDEAAYINHRDGKEEEE